jgi:excisionase family DNA binding protein
MCFSLDASPLVGLISISMDSYRTSLPPELDANRCRAETTDTAEPIIQADEILTVEETAAMLKVKKRVVYNLIFEGKLKAKRINKWNFRILKSEVDHIEDGRHLPRCMIGGTNDR